MQVSFLASHSHIVSKAFCVEVSGFLPEGALKRQKSTNKTSIWWVLYCSFFLLLKCRGTSCRRKKRPVTFVRFLRSIAYVTTWVLPTPYLLPQSQKIWRENPLIILTCKRAAGLLFPFSLVFSVCLHSRHAEKLVNHGCLYHSNHLPFSDYRQQFKPLPNHKLISINAGIFRRN